MPATFKNGIQKAFNTSILEKKRHVWIDYLRGIVIILVVYHHAFLGIERSGIAVPKLVINANMAAYSFRMPLFFIFSGLFTSLSLCTKSVRSIVWSKFNLLFYPYIIWSVIQITLQLVFSRYTNTDSSYLDYLSIFYQPKRLAQFWYLPALFNSTMVFVFIKSNFKIKSSHHFLLGILLFLLAPFVNEISMISNWMRFYVFLVIGDVLSHFLLNKEIQHKLKKPVYFLGFIPLFIIAQYYYFDIIGVRSLENDSASLGINYTNYIITELGFLMISLVGCATFILLSFLIEKWNRWKWLRIVGFHSLYIYIMHVIIVGFVRVFLMKVFGIHNYITILLTAVTLGLTIPIIFYNLIGKKYLWFLFSSERHIKTYPKITTDPVIRTSDVMLTPLKSSINNI